MDSKIKALGLCSGGLDSILAAQTLRQQKIQVEWISFETPFFSAENAKKAAHAYDFPIIIQNITSIYLDMLKDPPCGYGKHMNPCMDCHALMFRLAGQLMESQQYHFLFSGEVLGQRPMSQTRPSLRYVEKHSGYAGHILRPLSAKLLPETIAEKKGYVNRNLLLDISGRSRKRQIALAQQYNIQDYPAPAGGCLLTDEKYAHRLKDLMDHDETYDERDLNLLKYGRHLRLDADVKIIIGRNQKENEIIEKLHNPAISCLLKLKEIPGPLIIAPKDMDFDLLNKVASIGAGYGKVNGLRVVKILVLMGGYEKEIDVSPIPPKENQIYLI